MHYPIIHLKKGKEISLLRKHPWVFSGAIYKKDTNIKNGDLVSVFDAAENLIGNGIYAEGSIMVRMLTFDDTRIDQTYWNNLIGSALAYRKDVLMMPNDHTNTYRLFFGEGDGASGLIIDIYHNVAVVQCHNQGIYNMLPMVIAALNHNFGSDITTIYNKSKESLNDPSIIDGIVFGTDVYETVVKENNILFTVNWHQGQKTGFFLDQRDNRLLVGQYSKGKSVLNCFCYTGGFSMYAGKMGATHVASIDVSGKAMELTDANAQLNKILNHKSITANVMEYLKNLTEQYDIVIVDPPAFAKNIGKRHNAVQAYKRLNSMAIKCVNKGGLLFTFSCSQVVNNQLFYDTIVAAGIEAGRSIKVMHQLSQGADHPISLFHQEGHYLKGLMCHII